MGMCLTGNDRFSVEVRRESFIVHHDQDRNGADPHPEFLLDGLDDLIAALHEARAYCLERKLGSLTKDLPPPDKGAIAAAEDLLHRHGFRPGGKP